jgi:roadblock/LC7 domain-containing protein
LFLLLLAAFGGFLVLLAVQQNREYHEGAPDTFDYLLNASTDMPVDPLGISTQGLELVGVSDDGTVVGYASESDVAQTVAVLDQAMCARGWSMLEMDVRGVSSYVGQGESGAYVLFTCSARNGGASIVAQLL